MGSATHCCRTSGPVCSRSRLPVPVRPSIYLSIQSWMLVQWSLPLASFSHSRSFLSLRAAQRRILLQALRINAGFFVVGRHTVGRTVATKSSCRNTRASRNDPITAMKEPQTRSNIMEQSRRLMTLNCSGLGRECIERLGVRVYSAQYTPVSNYQSILNGMLTSACLPNDMHVRTMTKRKYYG